MTARPDGTAARRSRRGRLGNESVAAQDDEAAEEKRRNMKFCDIERLAFSFRNLAKIDNLRGLDNLTMLKLDNNQIERIEKLDHLVHLTWLDLSFNRISRIEGLSTMTKLTDLSLFDNRIQVIENLDECVSLHVISLGNNQLAKLDNVMYLRQFHNLRMVNLLGNPICHDPDYRSYVLSHIKGLSYLDYRRVCQSQVIAAKEQHQDEMIEIEEREEQQAQADAEMREKDQHLQLMAEANLDGVETLIDDMTLEDHEWERLNQIPGLLDEWGQLKDKFDAFTDEFKATILQQHEKKKAEYSEWLALAQKAVDDKDTAAKQAILEFEKKKKHAFLEVRENGQDVEHILMGPKVALMALKDKLMELEMETVDILQQLIQDFDRLYSEIIDANKQNYNQYFAMVRDQESKFAQQVTQSAMQIFEKYSQENSDTSVLPEEAKVLMSDKDVLMNSVQASHDAHTTKIDSLEDKLIQVEVKNADALVNKHAQWAYKRNRERVAEIVGYVEHTMMEMEELLVDPEDLE